MIHDIKFPAEREGRAGYLLLSEGGSWLPDRGADFYVPIRLVAHMTL
jgi:hypothetical protein